MLFAVDEDERKSEVAEWDDWENMRPFRTYTYFDAIGAGPFCTGEAAGGWRKGSTYAYRDHYTPSDSRCVGFEDYYGPHSSTWCSWNRNAGGAGAVAELQVRLQRAGYSLTADGIFGSITESRVKSFQTARGLKPVDGIVGRATWDALRAYR